MTKYYLKQVKEYQKLEPLLFGMDDEGIWEMIERKVMTNHIKGKSGLIHVFKKSQ